MVDFDDVLFAHGKEELVFGGSLTVELLVAQHLDAVLQVAFPRVKLIESRVICLSDTVDYLVHLDIRGRPCLGDDAALSVVLLDFVMSVDEVLVVAVIVGVIG